MIPRKIFQTFEQKSFEPEFQKIVDYWKTENPDFKYCLYDDNEREEFIKNNFPAEVYGTYMRIIPQAFKADLWRYCVLYTYGGFYADIDTACLGGLERFINSDTEFVAPIDLNLGDLEFHNIFNAFIGSIPNHPILKKCIDRIVLSVKKQEMPSENIMNFSGPGRLGIAVNQYLNRPDKETMVNFEGRYSKVDLIKFEHGPEYVRDLEGNKILQNKNGNPSMKLLYNQECKKIKNHFDWGKFGFKNVPFEQIVQTDNAPLKEKALFSFNPLIKEHLHPLRGIFSDKVYEAGGMVREGDVVLDLGASIGDFAFSIRDNKPKHIYCVEPDPSSCELLKINTKGSPVTIIPKAIVGENELSFNILNDQGEWQMVRSPDYEGAKTTFKGLVEDYKIDFIDFLKIDMEGGEYSLRQERSHKYYLQ